MPRFHFDAHEVTIRRTESGAKYVVTAESKTQLTAFAVSPKLLRDLAAQARRVLREHDAEQRPLLAASDREVERIEPPPPPAAT